MEKKILLCVDATSAQNPELIGLEDERLDAQPWLVVISDAQEARRRACRDEAINEAWVFSSDSMEGINLAAALRRDARCSEVSLVTFEGTGSVVSRCQAADVGLIRGRDAFVARYSKRKHAALRHVADKAEPVVGVHPIVTNQPEELTDLVVSSDDVLEPQPSRGRKIPVSEPRGTREGRVIVVVSGSGGVGKSTLAACLSVQSQTLGHRTLLLDADLQFGDMGFLVGQEPACDVAELLDDSQRLAQVEPKGSLPALIGPPKHVEQSELVMNRMSEVVSLVRPAFDVIVVNTGAFWSEQHAQLLEVADRTLFVLDQRPSSIRSCSHALDLCRRCGLPAQSFSYVLNFCSRHALLNSLDVSCALRGVSVSEVRDGGREVGELLGSGLPIELLQSKNPFSESLRSLWGELAEMCLPGVSSGSEPVAEKRGLLGSLRKRRAS